MKLGDVAQDAAVGLSAGAVAAFLEDLATRLISGIIIAVASALIVHLLRRKLEQK